MPETREQSITCQLQAVKHTVLCPEVASMVDEYLMKTGGVLLDLLMLRMRDEQGLYQDIINCELFFQGCFIFTDLAGHLRHSSPEISAVQCQDQART